MSWTRRGGGRGPVWTRVVGAFLLAACGGESTRAAVDAPADGGGVVDRTDTAAPPPEPDAMVDPPPPPEPDAVVDPPPPPPEPDAVVEPPPPPPEPDAVVEPPPPPPEPDAVVEPPPPPPEPDAFVEPPPPPEPDAVVDPPPPEPDGFVDPPPPPEPDAVVDPPPPPEPDAVVVDPPPPPDAGLPPAPDAGLPPVDPPRATSAELAALCRGGEPVSVFGIAAFAGPAGFYLAPATPTVPTTLGPYEPFGADERPVGLLARPVALGGPAFFLVVQGPVDCRVEARSLGGELRWTETFAASTCHRPLLAGDRLLLPVDGPEASRLIVRAADDGDARPGLDLRARWGASPVRLTESLAAVTTEDALWVLDVGAQPPVVVASLDVPDLLPAALTALDARSLVLTGRTAPDVPGVGDALLRVAFEPETFTLTSLGPAQLLPGPALASPVGGEDCQNPLANGGSHWWCPGGLVALGGDGWVRGFRFADGVEVLTHTPLDLRVTSLTMTRDGRIMNGGSHWQPGTSDYRLEMMTVGGGAAPEIAALTAGVAGAESCVGSPVVESDGLVIAAIVTPGSPDAVLVREQTFLGGLAPAWSRGASGDNLGTAAPVDPLAPCPGGTRALGARLLVGADFGLGSVVLPLPDGGFQLGGLRQSENGNDFVPWTARYDAAANLLWERRLALESEGETEVVGLALAGERLLAAASERTANVPSVRRLGFTLDGQVAFDISGFPGRFPIALAPLPSRGAYGILTEVEGAVAPDPVHFLVVIDADGAILDDVVIPLPLEVDFVAMTEAADGSLVLSGTVTDQAETWSVTYHVGPDGLAFAESIGSEIGVFRRVVDHALLPDGRVAVLGFDETAPLRAWVRFSNAFGGPEGEVEVGDARPAALVTTPEGLAVLSEDFSVRRLTPFGAPLALTEYAVAGVPAGQVQGGALAALDDGGLLLSGFVQVVDRPLPGGYVVTTGPWGQASCGGAGLCVGQVAADCAPVGPCASAECLPDTGECLRAALPDGVPCGSGLTCIGGACL